MAVWRGFAVSVRAAQRQSAGCLAVAHVGERQAAEGASSDCRYRNLSARSPYWASCVLSRAPGIHCDMDGAGSCMEAVIAKVRARC